MLNLGADPPVGGRGSTKLVSESKKVPEIKLEGKSPVDCPEGPELKLLPRVEVLTNPEGSV